MSYNQTKQAHSNGAITDDPARNQPQQFPVNFTVVAPLWTDYSSTGNAYYRLINDNDHSSLGAINHLLQAAGGAIEDPTTVLVATWDDMTCVSNGTVQVRPAHYLHGKYTHMHTSLSILPNFNV